MNAVGEAGRAEARPLKGAMLENSGLRAERMPGLAAALDGFIAEAPRSLAPLVSDWPGAARSSRRARPRCSRRSATAPG